MEIGCAYGFLIEELNKIDMRIIGLDKSEHAYEQSNVKGQIALNEIITFPYASKEYDWVISWNVMDCLDSESYAELVANRLNFAAKNQLHIISMSESINKNYSNEGYFIKSYDYWREIFPDAILVCSECKIVYDPLKRFSKIPLHWKQVSE